MSKQQQEKKNMISCQSWCQSNACTTSRHSTTLHEDWEREKHEKKISVGKIINVERKKKRQTCKSSFHFDEPLQTAHRPTFTEKSCWSVIAHRLDFHICKLFFFSCVSTTPSRRNAQLDAMRLTSINCAILLWINSTRFICFAAIQFERENLILNGFQLHYCGNGAWVEFESRNKWFPWFLHRRYISIVSSCIWTGDIFFPPKKGQQQFCCLYTSKHSVATAKWAQAPPIELIM